MRKHKQEYNCQCPPQQLFICHQNKCIFNDKNLTDNMLLNFKNEKILLCISSVLTEEHETWKSRNIWSLDKKMYHLLFSYSRAIKIVFLFFFLIPSTSLTFFPFQIIHQKGKILLLLSMITARSCRHTRAIPIGNKTIEITILLASQPTARMKH